MSPYQLHHINLNGIGEYHVVKHSIKMGFAAISLVIGLQAGGAQAAFNGAALASAAAEQATQIESVRWACGEYKCFWKPGHRGPHHAWAVWGAPRLPGCYYEKIRGAWL